MSTTGEMREWLKEKIILVAASLWSVKENVIVLKIILICTEIQGKLGPEFKSSL